MTGAEYSKRCWFTFPTRTQVEQPIIWQMCRKFPDVIFDIRANFRSRSRALTPCA
jgi:hypothetical protein